MEIVKFPACRCTHCGEAKEFFLPELMMSAPTVREQNLGISESRAVHLGRLILRGLQEERPQLKWIPFWVLNGDLSVVFRTSVVKRALFGDTNSIKETVVDRPNQRVCIAATSTRACGHLAFRAKLVHFPPPEAKFSSNRSTIPQKIPLQEEKNVLRLARNAKC
ncbi:MAG: hypothetical protein WC314_20645, partial [Vulcanimicrobiota bacterium]